eukprot:6332015-Alexandrium_andersonii.AAC.1
MSSCSIGSWGRGRPNSNRRRWSTCRGAACHGFSQLSESIRWRSASGALSNGQLGQIQNQVGRTPQSANQAGIYVGVNCQGVLCFRGSAALKFTGAEQASPCDPQPANSHQPTMSS